MLTVTKLASLCELMSHDTHRQSDKSRWYAYEEAAVPQRKIAFNLEWTSNLTYKLYIIIITIIITGFLNIIRDLTQKTLQGGLFLDV